MTIKQGLKLDKLFNKTLTMLKVQVMDPNLPHKCIGEKDQETSKSGIPESLFKEKEPDCLRQARHKDLCNDIGGGIMFCQDCEQPISTTDIVNQALKRWKDNVIQGARAQDKRPDTNITLSPERLDMVAYTFSYHMNGGCVLESDLFGGHNSIHKTLLKYRFEEHSACHCASCIKNGCKCRFLFPFMSTPSTYIHEDRGDNNKNETVWFCLNGLISSVYPFMFIPKRSMGCQFINACNKPISEVFNFNTYIQIGDALQVFYSTLYTSKSAQDEDSNKQLHIGCVVIKIIKHPFDENQTNSCDQTTSEPSFGEGLSRVLSGLNAATTRNVISSTMAHLISFNNGSWFVQMSYQIC
jgi:hypothetical protein